MQARKTKPKSFPLTSVAGRVGLLCGITAGTVTQEEVEAAVLLDTEKRPHRKAVVAGGQYFPSITKAAESLCGKKAGRYQVLAMQKNIARWCNEDKWEGYFWSA